MSDRPASAGRSAADELPAPVWFDGYPVPSRADGAHAKDGADTGDRMSPLSLPGEVERLRAELAAAHNKIANLEIGLASSRRIGAAVGIVMAQRRISQSAAFDLLRIASQTQHRKLREIAEEVLCTGVLDPGPRRRSATPPAHRSDPPMDPGRPRRAATAECLPGAGSDHGRVDTKGSAGQPTPAEPVFWRAVADRQPAMTDTPVDATTGVSAAGLAITARTAGDSVVLAVAGDLDVATTDVLTEIGVPAIRNPHCRVVELDLHAVTFLDCAGLRTLLTLRRDATAHHRNLRITRSSPPVDRLLTLARLTDNLEDATSTTRHG